MINAIGKLSGAVLLAALCGCSMCQHPFDYCNGVLGPGGCPNCEFGARKNSVFAPFSDEPTTTAMSPTPARAEPVPARPPRETAPPEEAVPYVSGRVTR